MSAAHKPAEAESRQTACNLWQAGGCIPGSGLKNRLTARGFHPQHFGRGSDHRKRAASLASALLLYPQPKGC